MIPSAHTQDIRRLGTHTLWMSWEQAGDELCEDRENENESSVMDYLALYHPPHPCEMN